MTGLIALTREPLARQAVTTSLLGGCVLKVLLLADWSDNLHP